MNYAWPAAAAFAAMCAAIAYATVHTPPPPPKPKTAQVVCIEQRGKWNGSGWGEGLGTCEFTQQAGKD